MAAGKIERVKMILDDVESFLTRDSASLRRILDLMTNLRSVTLQRNFGTPL
ncbi:hypothetical protein [Vulcanisaeta moutnovskia]|uniref:hypothetical protein n=1 Tax=Vulcanisaeta moutnovskia TaxID=985052 RepID=UPI000AD98E85|nr:hypothetical protein [Vulcanisaeta moutnovskia]